MKCLLLFLLASALASADTEADVQALHTKEAQLKVQLAYVAADLAAAQKQLASPQRPLPLDPLIRSALRVAAVSPDAGDSVPEFASNTAKRPYFAELLGGPAYSNAVFLLEKQQVWLDHAPFIRQLARTSEAMDSLATLLAHEALIQQDLEGIEPGSAGGKRTQVRVKLIRDWRRNIASAFGPEAVDQERAFNGSMRIRETLDALRTRLSYTADPLTDDEYAKLLAQVQSVLGPKVGSRYWVFSDSLVTAAASLLSPDQVAALREVAAERNAISQTRRS